MLVHCGRKRSDKVETFRFSLCIVGGSSVWFRNLPVPPSGKYLSAAEAQAHTVDKMLVDVIRHVEG